MIHVLSKETIDKIAAGEVVERPENVVKELVDNAIDAGASSISIEIRDGGLSLIRVTDDGAGIEYSDIKNAFLRHATSKLETSEDLTHITTMGFRGEALSSIAAVSDVELSTRVRGDLSGYIYKISGGKEISLKEAGIPEGTTVAVRDFLFNVPVRRGFLKSSQVENSYTSSIVNELALSHPEINFTLLIDGKNILETPGNDSLRDVIYIIYGAQTTRGLLGLDTGRSAVDAGRINVGGFIARPDISRSKRDRELFLINRRPVGAEILQRALEDAYKPYLMQHRFPFALLNIEMPPEDIDVNVHPRKAIVRFSDSAAVYDAVFEAVSERLKKTELIVDSRPEKYDLSLSHGTPDAKKEADKESLGKAPNLMAEKYEDLTGIKDFYGVRETSLNDPQGSYRRKEQGSSGPQDLYTIANKKSVSHFEPFEKKARSDYKGSQAELKLYDIENSDIEKGSDEAFISTSNTPYFNIIGQVFDTYWIIELKDEMYMIDQHAAHEKVNYERYIRLISSHCVESQLLFPPIVLSLDPKEAVLLEQNLESFMEFGYEIDHVGDRDFVVRSVPSNLPDIGDEKILRSFIDELFEEGRSLSSEVLKDRIATISCKASVKGGESLSRDEIKNLIKELLSLDNPYNCPHGRPTMIKWSKYEIDKLFKRIV